MQRQKSNLFLLRITITDLGRFGSTANLVEYFLNLHNCLQGHCLLKCDIPADRWRYVSRNAESFFRVVIVPCVCPSS